MTLVVLVIADDLTGALDNAGPFAARGVMVQVASGPAGRARVAWSRPHVLAIDTRSRNLGDGAIVVDLGAAIARAR